MYKLVCCRSRSGGVVVTQSGMMDDGMSVGSASGGGGGSSSASSTAGAEEVVLRINVPELKVEKCLQFHKDDLVWDVKQQALAALPKVRRGSRQE